MKTSKLPFALLPAIAIGVAALAMPESAQAGDSIPDLNWKPLFPTNPGPPPIRPHAPLRVYIQCYYKVGELKFVLPASIYSTTVELTNDWNAWSGFVTRDQPVMEIPYLEGDYTIKCNADDGKTYVGILEF